jgi:cell division protein FtsN
MRIELSSHTDARSSSEFNQSLSQKRAESAKQWLSKRGIDANRIDAVGYGETRPRNRCTDDVECKEEEHQFNRRTEFKITYFDEVLTSKPRSFDAGSVVSPWEKAAARDAFAKDTEATALENANALEDPANPWRSGTAFGIQVGIDRKPGSKRFSGFAWLGDIHVEASDRGFYRYVIGYVSTREEAEQVRNVLRDAGIGDAFVVTYEDGVRQR